MAIIYCRYLATYYDIFIKIPAQGLLFRDHAIVTECLIYKLFPYKPFRKQRKNDNYFEFSSHSGKPLLDNLWKDFSKYSHLQWTQIES